jgi:transposase-like protein
MPKPKPKPPARRPLRPEDRQPFLDQLQEPGASATAIAKAAGVTTRTLYRWAKDAGIDVALRHETPVKTAAATAANTQAWAARKADMADRIGEAAEKALAVCAASLEAGQARNAQAAAITLGTLIDKAQLLSGAATSRNGSTADPAALLEAGMARVSHLRPVKDA